MTFPSSPSAMRTATGSGCGSITRLSVLLILFSAFLCAGAPLRVLVSILPQAYLAERIGGDRIQVDVLVPPGQSPATYALNARRMARLADAAVWFRIGVPFENSLLPKLKSVAPKLEIVDTRQGIALRTMRGRHEHGRATEAKEAHHGHHHAEGATDPHIWMNPLNAVIQAATMRDSLCALDPAGCATYRRNCRALQADLEKVHEKLKKALAPVRGRTLMVFHPSFGYFADAYGLRQEAIEIEGKEPTGRQLAEIVRRAKKENVRVIFVQPQFSRKAARAVAAAVGAVVTPIDPLARNYLENLERIAATVTRELAKQQHHSQ